MPTGNIRAFVVVVFELYHWDNWGIHMWGVGSGVKHMLHRDIEAVWNYLLVTMSSLAVTALESQQLIAMNKNNTTTLYGFLLFLYLLSEIRHYIQYECKYITKLRSSQQYIQTSQLSGSAPQERAVIHACVLLAVSFLGSSGTFITYMQILNLALSTWSFFLRRESSDPWWRSSCSQFFFGSSGTFITYMQILSLALSTWSFFLSRESSDPWSRSPCSQLFGKQWDILNLISSYIFMYIHILVHICRILRQV